MWTKEQPTDQSIIVKNKDIANKKPKRLPNHWTAENCYKWSEERQCNCYSNLPISDRMKIDTRNIKMIS